MGGENILVRGNAAFWMKLSKPLRAAEFSGRMLLEEIFRLVFQVREVWICGKAFDRHAELPFVCPRSALKGLKVSSNGLVNLEGGLLSYPRTGCAPSRYDESSMARMLREWTMHASDARKTVSVDWFVHRASRITASVPCSGKVAAR